MDHSLPGTSVHGILQARILEWVAVSFSLWSGRNYLVSLLWPASLNRSVDNQPLPLKASGSMSQRLPDHCHHQGPSVSTKLPCLTVPCPLGVGQVTVSVNCTQANRCVLDHHLFLWTCFRGWKWHLLSLVQMVFDVSGWPKSCSRLSVHSHGKPQMNFWANPARDPRPPRE